MVRRILIFAVTVVVLVAGLAGVVRAQSAQDDQAALKQTLYNLDMSMDSLRKGDSDGSKSYLSSAQKIYLENLDFGGRIENVDNALDNRIKANFSSLIQTPVEDNIRALRADVSLAADKLGISIPETPWSFPWWLLPVVLAVALAIGLAAYLKRRGPKKRTPQG
jgi:hypothetical protein